jgi:SET domain-containing protein
MDADELNERYNMFTAPYAVQTGNRDEYIDSALERGVASLANTGIQKANCNCELFSDVRNHRVIIRAIRPIRQDEELLLYYGRMFRLDEPTRYHMKRYNTLY